MVHAEGKITGENDFQTTPDCIAVDQGHHRFEQIKTLGETCESGFRKIICSGLCSFLQIGSNAECAGTRAGDGCNPEGGILGKPVKCFSQNEVTFPVKSVEAMRTLKRDPHQRGIDFDQDRIFLHHNSICLPCSAESNTARVAARVRVASSAVILGGSRF